jgi:hypothetical protein
MPLSHRGSTEAEVCRTSARGICRLCILELEYRGYLNAEIQSEQEPMEKVTNSL